MNQTHHNFDQETKGWVDLVHPREPSKRLTTDLDARWSLLVLDFTGLSCARRLAELNPNEKIILLEAREIGKNASGRNSGYAVAHIHFSGGYQKSQLEHYQRIDRINQTGLKLSKIYYWRIVN